PHLHRRSRPRPDGLLARAVPRRPGDRAEGLRGRRGDAAGGHRRVHRLGRHPPGARQRRRARRQGACTVVRRPHTADRELMSGQLRILEGATFCICDELGDLNGNVEGLFAEDTRFLSSLRLTINGQRPLLLSSDKIEYFSAAFFMRNPLVGGLEQDVLSIRRERFVGDGMQDLFAVQNQGMQPIEFDLELEVGTDFADIFAVKDYDFALGDPLRAKPLPSLRPIEYEDESNQFLISDNGELPLKTQVIFSQRGEVDGSGVKFHLALEPRERWNLDVEIIPLPDGEPVATRFAQRRFGEEVGRVRDSLAAWQLRVPQLRTSWDALGHSFGQSVSD